jgi:hypothetical protein
LADAPKEAVKIEDAKADTAPSKDKKVSNQPNDMPPLENPDNPPVVNRWMMRTKRQQTNKAKMREQLSNFRGTRSKIVINRD